MVVGIMKILFIKNLLVFLNIIFLWIFLWDFDNFYINIILFKNLYKKEFGVILLENDVGVIF